MSVTEPASPTPNGPLSKSPTPYGPLSKSATPNGPLSNSTTPDAPRSNTPTPNGPTSNGPTSKGPTPKSPTSDFPAVVVAEDSLLLREGLVSLLQRFEFVVPAAVSGPDELLNAVATHRPDLVLTDVRMPPGFRDEGLRAAIELRRRQPGLPVMVLSQYVEQVYASQLLADGESGLGYLLKDRITDVRTLVSALREVLAGGTVVDPEVVRRLLSRRREPLARLSDRERETLALMAEGRSNAGIASQLVVTEATVAKHIRNLFDKLELPPAAADHRRVLAVITYLQQGEG